MTPIDCWKIPVLYYIHLPYNFNGNKRPGGGIDKSNKETANYITQLLNYRESYPDAVTECR